MVDERQFRPLLGDLSRRGRNTTGRSDLPAEDAQLPDWMSTTAFQHHDTPPTQPHDPKAVQR